MKNKEYIPLNLKLLNSEAIQQRSVSTAKRFNSEAIQQRSVSTAKRFNSEALFIGNSFAFNDSFTMTHRGKINSIPK
jgi:hypothetical protein